MVNSRQGRREMKAMRIGALELRNNVVLAPMAGITDVAFRLLARESGSALCFTEMISANGLVRGGGKSYRYLVSTPTDTPLGAQIFGADPEILSRAAEIVTEHGVDLVDINMGCPVKKVAKTGAGAAMMRDPSKVASVLRAVRRATPLPLSVKIRAGWKGDPAVAIEIARIAEDCGVDCLILHPRTAEQGFRGFADWSLIRDVKNRITIPLIGNGDIRSPEDACRMLDATGCDGIMIGRGALGNPWIFRDTTGYLKTGIIPSGPSAGEREDLVRRHLHMLIQLYGEGMGVKVFRKFLLWYTKGLRGGSKFRQEAMSIVEKEKLLELLHEFLNVSGGSEENRAAFS